MNETYRAGKVDLNVTFNFNEKLSTKNEDISRTDLLNIGYIYIQSIYQKLQLSQFFCSIVSDSRLTFNCDEVNRFLTYARILNPDSKYGTFDKQGAFYEKPNVPYHHIIRFMDILESHSKEYIEHLFCYSEPIVKRDISIM